MLAGALAAAAGARIAWAAERQIGWISTEPPESAAPYLKALRDGIARQLPPGAPGVQVIERNVATGTRNALGQPIYRWALYDRDPVNTWCSGRVGLIGDAAHPVLPFGAQGAGIGLEDTEALAHLLARWSLDRFHWRIRRQRRRLCRCGHRRRAETVDLSPRQ